MADNDLLPRVLDFLREASRVALEGQRSARVAVKADSSLVTEVDLRISEMALAAFEGIAGPGAVITEEVPGSLERLLQPPAAAANELLVIVDPLDGTHNYTRQMPLYGISVGILRAGRPWIGAVAFPALDEMVYGDGKKAWYGRRLADRHRADEALSPPRVELMPTSAVLCSVSFLKRHRWDHGLCDLLVTGCATIELCWPLLGRGAAALFGAHPWDLAGSWPLLHSLGFTLRGVRSGRELRHYDPADYDPRTKRLAEFAVMCRPEHYPRLAAAVG